MYTYIYLYLLYIYKYSNIHNIYTIIFCLFICKILRYINACIISLSMAYSIDAIYILLIKLVNHKCYHEY